MKAFQKLVFICCCILPFYIGIAQSQSINYKAIIRDNTGAILANDLVIIQFTILEGTTNVYSENHTPTTDANGLVILNIGEGTVLSGDYTTIDWATIDHFLNVQINTGSGLVDMGTTQFLSVPYALHAQTAQNVLGLAPRDESNGIGWRLTGIGDDSSEGYGAIGLNAIDLSVSDANGASLIFPYGATGEHSFAAGVNTIATAPRAIAMGHSNRASGSNSVAMGSSNIASNSNATALGFNNTASGSASFAAGGSNTASGDGSVVFGSSNDAIGLASFVSGIGLHADAYLSTVFGRGNIGGGNPDAWVPTDPLFEIGIGQPIGSNDDNALTVYKNGNIAVANGRVSSLDIVGEDAIAFGNALSVGTNTVAYGNNSIAQGQNTFSGGTNSNAIGENAMAIGRNNFATGENSVSMGVNNSASSYGEVVVGPYAEFITSGSSDTFDPEDRVFTVGNGTNTSNRSNAITILKNGNTGIGTSAPQERLHIANGRLRIGTETVEDTGSNRLEWNCGLFPDTDNSFQLGGSALRWEAVWATDGTINTSDRRAKKDIKGLNYGLREILKLDPIRFRWKAKPEQGEKLGLIAQDLLEIIPEVVKTHEYVTTGEGEHASLEKKELDRLGVYYTDLIPVLIKAIQEQQEIIQSYKNEQQENKAAIADLQSQMNQLSELLQNKSYEK